jgi:hypothetical protein
MATTPIGIRGDREYVNNLNGLAEALKTTVSDLVRAAVDEKYGDQLAVIERHRAEIGKKIYHSVTESTRDVAS